MCLGILSIMNGKYNRSLLGFLDPNRTLFPPDVIPFGTLLPPTRRRNLPSARQESSLAMCTKHEQLMVRSERTINKSSYEVCEKKKKTSQPGHGAHDRKQLWYPPTLTTSTLFVGGFLLQNVCPRANREHINVSGNCHPLNSCDLGS